jgi:hypothetical protein
MTLSVIWSLPRMLFRQSDAHPTCPYPGGFRRFRCISALGTCAALRCVAHDVFLYPAKSNQFEHIIRPLLRQSTRRHGPAQEDMIFKSLLFILTFLFPVFYKESRVLRAGDGATPRKNNVNTINSPKIWLLYPKMWCSDASREVGAQRIVNLNSRAPTSRH